MKITPDLCWKLENDRQDIFNFRMGDKIEIDFIDALGEAITKKGNIWSLSKEVMFLIEENKSMFKSIKISRSKVKDIRHIK